MKTEPTSYSIHDLAEEGTTFWDGVRNYQARNYMRAMQRGDKVVVYHSNAEPSGAAGIAVVSGTARIDETAFDLDDHHYDPRSTPERPLWDAVDVDHHETFPGVVPLEVLRDDERLGGMMLTSGKAMRLSIQPLDKKHFERIVALGRKTKT